MAAPPEPESRPAPSTSSVAPIVMPDASLPPPGSANPPNFFPDPGVLAWAVQVLDSVSWSSEERKNLKSQFVPEPEHAHIFEPVGMPQEILDAMKHKTVVASDYLFRRYAAELQFYKANGDLTAGFGPLLQVISNMTGMEGMEHDRYMLGHVFHSMAATVDKMSRGRRELARRFVPLENAPSLLSSKPTHSSIFGGGSTQDALDVATKNAKKNKDLVYRPKVSKKPFQRAGVYGRGFPRYPQYPQHMPFYPQYNQSYMYPRGGYTQFQQGRNQYQPWYQQRGYYPSQSLKRGQRGRGKKGKKRQAAAANYQSY